MGEVQVSIALTKQRIKARLQGITSPQAFAKVYDQPKEATSIGEMPCAIISLTPQAEHTWRMAAVGLGRNDYTLTIWIFVGNRSSNLGDLISRSELWIEPIADALFASITLDDAVEWIGAGDSDALFTYQMGPIAWEKEEYFGLKLILPVTEKPDQEMGP